MPSPKRLLRVRRLDLSGCGRVRKPDLHMGKPHPGRREEGGMICWLTLVLGVVKLHQPA